MNKFDINSAPLEIERRYLIEYPDIDALRRMDGYRVKHISQTYLQAADDFVGGRIRRIVAGDKTTYVYTYKMRLSDMTRREYEKEISLKEYNELLPRRIANTITIEKDRHIFEFAGLTYELDVYDFWDDRASLEAEVDSEDVAIPIPPCVTLIKEVTDDRRYNNSRLAVNRGIIE